MKKGMFSESDMTIVKSYFSNMITDNKNRMRVFKLQLNEIKEQISGAEFDK